MKNLFLTLIFFPIILFGQTYTVTKDVFFDDTYTIKKQSDAYENPKYILPQTYNYGNFSDAFTNAYNQGIQNAANLSAIRANRAASEAQRIQAFQAEEERRLKYEERAVKNPSNDFNRGFYQTFKKIKVGKKRYSIKYFRPETWQFVENKSRDLKNPFLVFLSRQLSDGTTLRCWIDIASSDEIINKYKVNYPGEALKNFIKNVETVHKLQYGYGYDLTKRDENGFLIITEIVPESAMADAGIKKGDVLISIDGIKTNSDNFDSERLSFLKDKEFGHISIVEVKRDGVVVEGPVKPKIRDGFFKGNINISGGPGYFYSTKLENELYGEKQEFLQIYNVATLGPDLITVNIEIKPKSLEGNLDFEFKRFKRSIITLLNNIQIEN